MSFANIYDQLMADIDFNEIYDFIKPFIKDKKTLLDAGCGSGYLTELYARDFITTAIDLDEDMLYLARTKLEQANLKADFYLHDLNDELSIKYDVITMLFDVVNYFEDPKKMFINLYKALNDEGILIFDIYKEEMLDSYKNYEEIETDPFNYVWKIDVKGQKIEHEINAFDEIDRVIQYIYSKSYYVAVLKQIGFNVDVILGPDERKYYMICKK